MESIKILDLISYTTPSVITGIVAYLFFLNYTKTEKQKIKLMLLKESQKDLFPIKLQAYERMTLFLERINPSRLLLRVTSVNNDKEAYTISLINTVEQEFEHNLAQQIYVSEECWNYIKTAKNSTIQLIKKTSEDTSISNAQELRETVLKKLLHSSAPSNIALTFIKSEVKTFV